MLPIRVRVILKEDVDMELSVAKVVIGTVEQAVSAIQKKANALNAEGARMLANFEAALMQWAGVPSLVY